MPFNEGKIQPTSSLEITGYKDQQTAVLGDYEGFMRQLQENMANAKPEEVTRILNEVERFSQSPDRTIEVYTDPELETFCCGQVPSKKVNQKGEIVDDPNRKTYLIGVPFIFAAGKASAKFLRGEIRHERGHAEWTDFGRMKRFETLARQEGYDPSELLALDNCIEDPRMERLVGGPIHEAERQQLFEKNRQMIIPNISGGLKKGGMSPSDQFKFLCKLERLWAIHEKDLQGVQKPWSLADVHPRARQEYEKIAPVMSRITGDSIKPAMKVNAEVEQLIVQQVWPALKRLIDEFPDEASKKSGKGKKGSPSQGGTPEDNPNLDPGDPSTWPPDLQKFFKKMVDQHNKKLQQQAKQTKENADKSEGEQTELDKKKHELDKSRDNFEDPVKRSRYAELSKEVRPVRQAVERIFDRFLPKTVEPSHIWGKRGIRFSVQRYVRKIGTGYENPMGKRNTPEEAALALQIIIDGSGSMYNEGKERIENALKAAIACCEASQDRHVAIEVLISDDKTVEEDSNYLIKGFDEHFDGKVKSRFIWVLDRQGGDNQDAKSIRVAVPRIKKRLSRLRAEADRVGALSIFISDSTTESEDTRQAADEARTQIPFEGTAITPEGDIPAKVKYHFGSNSIIPRSLPDFPSALQQIIQRNVGHLKPKQ